MADISTANLDAASDSPRLARAQLLEAVQKVNDHELRLTPLSILGGGSASHSDGTNTLTGSARWYLGNKPPSTDDSALLVGRNLIGSYAEGAHGVRDETSWNYTGAGLGGYASFDSIVTATGSQTYDHLHGFQGRPQYAGTGLMGQLAGYTAQVGTSGDVYDALGMLISDPTGTGDIENNYGLYISPMTRGSVFNYSIYAAGSSPSFFGGSITTNNELIATNLNAYSTPVSFRATGGMLVAYNGSGQGVLRAYTNSAGASGQIAFTNAGGQFAQYDANGYHLLGFTSSNGAYRLQVNSQIYATSSVVATSDKRYKTAVRPICGALGLVQQLAPVSFDWLPHAVHQFPAGRAVGFLAQDVAQVLAGTGYEQAVVKTNSTVMPDGTTEQFFGLAEGALVPLLVSAVQELAARVRALEGE
jgi:hypothetical protein